MANNYYTPSPDEIESRRRGLDEYNIWNERALFTIWSLLGRADTYIDFGSGNGHMVKMARACGVDAVGVDIIAEPPDIIHDLRRPLDLGRKFQLATSIEVAEHLTPEASDTFCETVVKHLIDNGGWLVFTAALPGQMGQNHVNLRTPYGWREILTDHGLTYHMDATIKLAYLWKLTTGSLHHLPANLQVFVKGTP
jgi:cyclopropane fatty-acyl-phospholipid synthase-like methyltransferase